MKDYYGAIKKYIMANYPEDSKEMKELESIKDDGVKLVRLYNHYKRLSYAMNKNIDESNKMTKSKFKEYIKEVIVETLSEENLYKVTTTSGEEVLPFDNDQEANDAKKYGNVKNIRKLEELEPNKNQKLKLANKELAFLAKKVRSLEKQLKSIV